MGYTTPIFGIMIEKKQEKDTVDDLISTIDDEIVNYGPTTEFPFRSILLDAKKNEVKRIWLASASHAEAGRLPAEIIFPNLICGFMNTKNACEVINASKAGMGISENISQLIEYAGHYKPDYAILYQMSMDISRQQTILTKAETSSSSLPSNSLFDYSEIKTIYQSLSLYGHLTDYIGGNVKLEGQLKNSIPLSDDDFEIQIRSFIYACRYNKVKPILTTFAASHDLNNIHKMHHSIRTSFVKYNTYLSPVGWINTVSRYNNLIRKISKSENVPLIDIAEKMNGDYQYYIDFVHFNEQGHTRIANIISEELGHILSQEGIYYGL